MATGMGGALPAGAGGAVKLDRSAIGWALFEGARNPYVTVCLIYVFAPYVATVVIGDPVEGQAQIADLNKWAGLIAAFAAPLLGAAADRAGARKGPLSILAIMMVMAIGSLWFVTPPGEGSTAWIWFPLLLLIGALFPLTDALHNAMLPGATSPKALPFVSGLGLALGNAATVLILLFVLIFLAFPGKVDWPFVPAQPLFGLSQAANEPERFAAVICAVWMAIMALPIFLWTRDTARGESWGSSLVGGLSSVARTLRKLRDLGDVGKFLVARMIYTDGKTAMIVLGGVYAAGIMRWGVIEMTIYGIVLSVLATIGGFVGGWLDAKVGPKRAIQLEIGFTLLGLLGMVSSNRETIWGLIRPDLAPVWGAPFFKTLPELAFLGTVGIIAIFITAAYASSRTMMTRLAPPHMVGELFGLYALAGTATAWLGPMMVSFFTRAFNSQQAGFASLAILLVAGFGVLLTVKPPPEPE